MASLTQPEVVFECGYDYSSFIIADGYFESEQSFMDTLLPNQLTIENILVNQGNDFEAYMMGQYIDPDLMSPEALLNSPQFDRSYIPMDSINDIPRPLIEFEIIPSQSFMFPMSDYIPIDETPIFNLPMPSPLTEMPKAQNSELAKYRTVEDRDLLGFLDKKKEHRETFISIFEAQGVDVVKLESLHQWREAYDKLQSVSSKATQIAQNGDEVDSYTLTRLELAKDALDGQAKEVTTMIENGDLIIAEFIARDNNRKVFVQEKLAQDPAYYLPIDQNIDPNIYSQPIIGPEPTTIIPLAR